MTALSTVTDIVGNSIAARKLRELIVRAAPLPLPVLIQGPTGGGKELVARALHAASNRPGRFVALNVCAVADTMLEDALFGHVRGAFSGAIADSRGFLAEADRGTVFLDEISGLSLTSQAKLLRAVELREFRPVGAKEDRRSDFRVFSATNENIDELIRTGRFRRDLAHRLSAIVIEVPPLSDRLEDIPSLAQQFALEASQSVSVAPRFTDGAIRLLQMHPWPGNIRELRHVIEYAVGISVGCVITRDKLRLTMDRGCCLTESVPAIDDLDRRRLLNALESLDWDTARAGVELGVNRSTVYKWMQRCNIKVPHRPTRRLAISADAMPAGSQFSRTG